MTFARHIAALALMTTDDIETLVTLIRKGESARFVTYHGGYTSAEYQTGRAHVSLLAGCFTAAKYCETEAAKIRAALA
jgi:hypothetical protein